MAPAVWRYAGVDLATLGVSVMTADGVKGAPPVRGKNLLIPYQRGQRWVLKFYDERTIVLQGRISAATPTALSTAIDQLVALFPINSGEQLLEVQQPDGTFRNALAEVRNHLLPVDSANGARSSKWSIELVASDPYWYSGVLAAGPGLSGWTLDSGVSLDDGAHWFDQTIGAEFAVTLTKQATVIALRNPGTGTNRRPVITLVGQMTNPKVTNFTNGESVQALISTTVSDTLVIDCGAQAISLNGMRLSSAQVALGADLQYPRLEAGDNNVSVDVGIATPSVSFKADFSAAYL